MLLRTISYAWRVPATGFAFAVFGLGGLLLAATIFPLITLVTPDPEIRKRRTRTVIRGCFQFFVLLMRCLGVIRVARLDRVALARCRGKIVISNHPTLIDVVLLVSIIPNAQCVVKHQLWRNLFLGGVMRAAGYIRNDLEPDLFIAACDRAVKSGDNLVIFPEGTRSIPGRKLRFQRGFANIALLTDADLQLVRISCHPIMLNKGTPWYRVPEQPGRYQISLGEQVAPGPFLRSGSRALAARKLVSFLESCYADQ